MQLNFQNMRVNFGKNAGNAGKLKYFDSLKLKRIETNLARLVSILFFALNAFEMILDRGIHPYIARRLAINFCFNRICSLANS